MGPQQLPQYYRNKNPPTDSIFGVFPPLAQDAVESVASMNLLIAWDAPKSHPKVKGSPRVVSVTRIPGGWGEQPGRQHFLVSMSSQKESTFLSQIPAFQKTKHIQ